MIRASQQPQVTTPAFRGARRPDRRPPRDQVRPSHVRLHRHHAIRCLEADREIREAFGGHTRHTPT